METPSFTNPNNAIRCILLMLISRYVPFNEINIVWQTCFALLRLQGRLRSPHFRVIVFEMKAGANKSVTFSWVRG